MWAGIAIALATAETWTALEAIQTAISSRYVSTRAMLNSMHQHLVVRKRIAAAANTSSRAGRIPAGIGGNFRRFGGG
ncbi:hypothetical protein [Microbaculum marinisediminis]|uniref:Uncharacterized protein n=1 Tax=Microbaculum marinisediminis TaxID=2931392 RepID=A0AAW5R4A7_9HYPH|nr:hypothetical protein [Microbaculum sp. A6E488]MCT8973370.1 hypothetical protein [Microbaculum sp. A6E488]